MPVLCGGVPATDTCDRTGNWTQSESADQSHVALKCDRKPCKGYPATGDDGNNPDPHTACKADRPRTEAATTNGHFEDTCTAICSGRDGKGYSGTPIGDGGTAFSPGEVHATSGVGKPGYRCATSSVTAIYVPGRGSESDPGFEATQDECEKLCGVTEGCNLWQWGHGQDFEAAQPPHAWCYLLKECGGLLFKDAGVRAQRSKPSASGCLCCAVHQPLSEISR